MYSGAQCFAESGIRIAYNGVDMVGYYAGILYVMLFVHNVEYFGIKRVVWCGVIMQCAHKKVTLI